MEYLKKFATQEEYQSWKDGDDYEYPNICKVGGDVVYNNFPDPLWIEALEDIQVDFKSYNGYYYDRYGYYSIDKKNWFSFDSSPNPVVRTGQRIYVKCVDSYSAQLYISGKYNIGGSVNSLRFGDDYLKVGISGSRKGYGNLTQYAKSVVNAKELVLPPYTWYTGGDGNGFFEGIFKDCAYLETPPRLTTMRITDAGVYLSSFEGCTSLKKAPTIPNASYSTSYTKRYHERMFFGCSNLQYIKLLTTDSFGSHYAQWVEGVSPTGVFIANAKRTDFTRGVSGIPEGWDLYLYDEEKKKYVVKFKVNEIPYEFYTDEPKDVTWSEFINSEWNTNGFYSDPNTFPYHPIVFERSYNYVLLDGNYVLPGDKIIINTSYTIGPRPTTTEE